MTDFVLALDQGTTSSRAIVFNRLGRAVGQAEQEFKQIFPQPGRLEHNPESIWESQLAARKAIETAGIVTKDLAAVGITNPCETTVLWDQKKSLHAQRKRALDRARSWGTK